MAKLPSELRPDILIKRVMSGTKEYRSHAYLEAFSKLSSSQLHSNSENYSYLDVIKLWNSLQSTPNKVRYFTFSLVKDNKLVQKRIKEYYNHAKYAWICHDKDTSSEHKHYHYVLMFDTPRSFRSIADDLELPVTLLQKVYSKKGILDYLTHENDPNKYHYSLDEITANFDIEEEKKKDGGIDPWQEFCDYKDMITGIIPFKEWFDKYHYVLCDVGSFTQRQQLYHRILESCTGASLSSRSECPVPHPRSKKPIQTAFPSTRPEQIPWLDHGASFVVGTDNPKPRSRSDYRKPNPRSDLNDIV